MCFPGMNKNLHANMSTSAFTSFNSVLLCLVQTSLHFMFQLLTLCLTFEGNIIYYFREAILFTVASLSSVHFFTQQCMGKEEFEL